MRPYPRFITRRGLGVQTAETQNAPDTPSEPPPPSSVSCPPAQRSANRYSYIPQRRSTVSMLQAVNATEHRTLPPPPLY